MKENPVNDDLPQLIGQKLNSRKLTISTMESCTGGNVIQLLTTIKGSSAYVRGSIVSYATDGKVQFGVKESTIKEYGVISNEVALEMAQAAVHTLHTDIGIGVTGLSGDSLEGKPSGQVHIGTVTPEIQKAFEFHFEGNRNEITDKATYMALQKLFELL